MKHNRIYLATLAASLSLTIGSGDASAQRKISGQLEEVIVTRTKARTKPARTSPLASQHWTQR